MLWFAIHYIKCKKKRVLTPRATTSVVVSNIVNICKCTRVSFSTCSISCALIDDPTLILRLKLRSFNAIEGSKFSSSTWTSLSIVDPCSACSDERNIKRRLRERECVCGTLRSYCWWIGISELKTFSITTKLISGFLPYLIYSTVIIMIIIIKSLKRKRGLPVA